MTPVDIDRIIGTEAPLEPSPRFASRVMRAVQADAAGRRQRTIAWRHLWPAAATVSVLAPVAVAAQVLGTGQWSAAHADIMFWLTLTTAGTLALASWSGRLATRF